MTLSRRLPVALALAVAAAACTPTGRPQDPGARVLAGEGDRPYVAGSPRQREAIEALVARLGTVEGDAFLDLARRLAVHGESAVPPLLTALASTNPLARGQSVYVLGAIRDRRAIPPIADVATGDPVPRVRYEAAAALLDLRDPRGLEILVVGLEDPDARLRGKCAEVLLEETGRSFGFAPDDAPDDRAEAVRRWRAWLEARAEELPGLPEAPAVGPDCPETPAEPREPDGGTAPPGR